MKTTLKSSQKKEILKKIEDAKAMGKEIGNMGLKIEYGESREFYNTIDELMEAVKNIDTENIYLFNIEVDAWRFLNIKVNVLYLNKNEIGKPLELVRIARNLKALNDSNYSYSDDHSVWNFWKNLRDTLNSKMKSLTDNEKSIVNNLAQCQ